MKSIIVLLAIIGLASCTVPQECLDSSWAPHAVASLVSQPLESGYDVQNAVNALWNATQLSNSPFFWSLYYGTDNGNFYFLHDCDAGSAENSLTACASSTTRYVFTFVDGAALLNYMFYHEVSDTGVVNPISFANSAPRRFNPTDEIWYVTGAGWTDRYSMRTIYGDLEVTGTTYHTSFTGGVAGGDRFQNEPCGTCFQSNPTTVWADVFAAQANAARLTSVAEIVNYANTMMDTYFQISARRFSVLRAGFSNNDYYAVGDCFSRNINCYKYAYALYARNTAVFGNNSVVLIPLDGYGNLIAGRVTYGPAFTTTAASWYTVEGFDIKESDERDNGFTTTYTVPLRGNGFGRNKPNGVISSELYTDFNNDCVLNNNSEKTVVALFLAPIVALFALLM